MTKQASKRAADASTSTSEGAHASEAAEAVEKIARLTERNKKAQAKYREKQKNKVVGLEAECQALKSELGVKNSALTRLEAQKAALQAKVDALQNQAKAQTTVKVSDEVESSQPQPLGAGTILRGGEKWVSWEASKIKGWEHLIKPLIAKYQGELSARLHDRSVRTNPPASDTFAIYKDLVELMASKLAEAAANPSSATLQVIEDVVDAMREIQSAMQQAMPVDELMERWYLVGQEIFAAYGMPSKLVWSNTLAAAGLSAQQLAELSRLKAEFCESFLERSQGTRNAVLILAAAAQASPNKSLLSHQVNFGQIILGVRQLRTQGVEVQGSQHYALQRAIYGSMSKVQHAKMMVACFPYLLDLLAVVDAVDELLAGQPGVLQPPPQEALPPELSLENVPLAAQWTLETELDVNLWDL